MKLILTTNLLNKTLITKNTTVSSSTKYYLDQLDTSIIEYFYIHDIDLYISFVNIEWLKYKLRKFKFIEYGFEIDKIDDKIVKEYVEWEYRMRNGREKESVFDNMHRKSRNGDFVKINSSENNTDGKLKECRNDSLKEVLKGNNIKGIRIEDDKMKKRFKRKSSIKDEDLKETNNNILNINYTNNTTNKIDTLNIIDDPNKSDTTNINSNIQRGLEISFNSDIYKSIYTSLTNPSIYKHKMCSVVECFRYVVDNKSVECTKLHSMFTDKVVFNLVYTNCIVKKNDKYFVNEYFVV